MSNFNIRSVLALFSAAVLLSGCSVFRQAREDVKPQAVPAMVAAQTLNPEAGKNRKVVAGLDGAAAKNVELGYVNSFERKASTEKIGASFVGLSGISSD